MVEAAELRGAERLIQQTGIVFERDIHEMSRVTDGRKMMNCYLSMNEERSRRNLAEAG